jgi:hypothetical protein
MKKLFILLAAVVMTASAMAQHEIGLIAGGINGASYKYWCSDRLAVQTDLAVGLTVAPGGVYYRGAYGGGVANSQYDFTLNPNAEYHFPLSSNLQLYAGGGLNLGLVSDLANVNPNLIMGKFGINSIVGLSLFTGNNISLAVDFRPGYGLAFYNSNTAHFSFFDWKVGLAVRYRI